MHQKIFLAIFSMSLTNEQAAENFVNCKPKKWKHFLQPQLQQQQQET